MKLLLDENISYKVAERLRQAGYDVLSVYEIELTETEDEILFDYAQKVDMVLVTQDLDFSDLNYLAQFAGSGLIILRLRNPSSSMVTSRLLDFLETYSSVDMTNRVAIISYKAPRFYPSW